LIQRAGIVVHQARLAQLAREAGRTTVQHVAGYERQRRHATLVAGALDLAASLTDQAVDLFDRLIGTMFRKADARHARAFQADGRAINEKVRLYARVGAALIAARDNQQDAFDAITAVIPWDRFLDRRGGRGAGAVGRVRSLPDARRALCRHPPLGSGLPCRVPLILQTIAYYTGAVEVRLILGLVLGPSCYDYYWHGSEGTLVS
jgi:hypothetical protein